MDHLLVDAHCHLADVRFEPGLEVFLTRARQAGVSLAVCCGTCEEDWARVTALAMAHRQIIPSFGLHPWYVGSRTGTWLDNLAESVRNCPNAGVGEIGLDWALEGRDETVQRQVFDAQLDLADQYGRPVSIHCRRAWGPLLEILRHRNGVRSGGIIHSYSGAPDLIPELETFGLGISFSGSITRPGNRKGPRAALAVSSRGLVIETDSPDLVPAGCETPLNEPANLPLVLDALATRLGVTPDELARRTGENARRIFVR